MMKTPEELLWEAQSLLEKANEHMKQGQRLLSGMHKTNTHLVEENKRLKSRLDWAEKMLERARTFIASAYDEGVSGTGDKWLADFDRGPEKK